MVSTTEVRDDALKPAKKREEAESRYFMNPTMDLVGYSLVAGTLVGSGLLYSTLDEFFASHKQANPSYQFPTMTELIPGTLLYFLLIMLTYYGISFFLKDFCVKLMDAKLLREADTETLEINKIKICTTFFKAMFYFSSSLFGYLAFRNEDYFPASLGGSGQYSNIFAKGYPDYFYFERSVLFNNYYQFNLAFVLFDNFILLTHALQSDFLFMLVHHISTLSLILFSFVTNYSKCGLVIYFLHYVSDILTYGTRITLHCNFPDIAKCLSAVLLLVTFIYTRIYVFGQLQLDYYYDSNIKFTAVEYSLVTLKFALFTLHVLWSFMIFKKILNFVISKDVADIYKIKKKK